MQTYYCKNCDAVLYWDTRRQCLKCRYCDEEYQVTDFEDASAVSNATKDTPPILEENFNEPQTSTQNTETEMIVYECVDCGGEVVALPTTMATVCPYCGKAISITSKTIGDFRPDAVIPFQFEKKEIMDFYKAYVNRSKLTPKIFKQDHIVDKIQGIFVPFHLHSMRDVAHHRYRGEKISHSKRGDDRINTHTVYACTIDTDSTFKRIPTDAAVTIDNSLMDALEPFDYKGVQEYNPAYMAGFVAEQKSDSDENMNLRAINRTKQAINEKTQRHFGGYNTLTLEEQNHNIQAHETEYIMLPIWMLNVSHKDKNYQFAVNGQTGKVVGKLPIDMPKLIGRGVLSFFITFLICSVILSLI